MTPGPNGCTCGFNGDCNCPFVASKPTKATQRKKHPRRDYQAEARVLFDALKLIATAYMTPDQICRAVERRNSSVYGLLPDEAIGMAYENVLAVAKAAIRGRRRP